MINFRYVELKNFLSVGDNPLRLDLNRHPTTLVTGRNGSGKSVLVSDSLTFVLFGKSYRGINKPALINTINQRDSVVEIEFSKGNDVYKIVRGQKPARLEIYKNNAALNEEAAVRDTQAYIENDILGFDCNSFIRVCVMSTMNYTPFMQLSAFERRNLVENMLTLKSFSEMSKIHKANVSNLKERITSLQNDLSVRKATYDEKNRTYNLLQQIDSDRTDSIKSNLKGLGEKLEFNEEVVRKLEIQIEEANLQLLNDSALEYKGKIQQIQREIREYEVEISQAEKKVVYFKDHQDCDQCHQSISKESAIESISRYSAIMSDHTSAIENLKTRLKVVGDKLDEVNAKIAEVKELEQDLSFAKKSSNVIATDIRKKLQELEKPQASSDEAVRIKNEIDEVRGQIKYIASKYEEACAQKDVATIASELLKDTGIKAGIIKQYIPLLVGYVNHYLEQLNISIKFSMDENFNESITTRYANEYQYQNLSMGERSRLDLALAFAWRQVAKLKGSVYCNILILDEILDHALDIDGTTAALSLLDSICEDSNIFIISHKANLDESVRSIIALEKVNGFTKIVHQKQTI